MPSSLFPVFDAPEIYQPGQQSAGPRYGRGLRFDFDRGDFVLDGAGRFVTTDGHTAWVHWCVKAILTERFAYLVYGPNYGVELEGITRETDRRAAEARIERAITEALLVDPRTESVRQFAFTWSDSGVNVSFTLYPVIGTPERVEVTLRG